MNLLNNQHKILFIFKSSENITEKNVEFEGLHGETHTIDGRFIIVKVSASVEGQELTAAVLNGLFLLT